MAERIRFENISKVFPGTTALDDVSFSIKRGEIHAIVGANGAGKSTLMNILGGQYKNDQGKVFIDGKQLVITNPDHSRRAGIAVVYQELKLCDNLTVVENVFLGNELRKKSGGMDWKKMRAEAAKILKAFKIDVGVNEMLSDLTIGKKQLVEIAKAVCLAANIIIFDEPTSSLSMKEVKILFDIIKDLKSKGLTILFISHRMGEVFEISDRITVLRDGKWVGTFNSAKVNSDQIVDMIAGKELSAFLKSKSIEKRTFAKVILEVDGISKKKLYKNVSLKLYEGEILGIYGLQGAGRTELIQTIFGLLRPDEGKIKVWGKNIIALKTKQRIDLGIAMVPEDRKGYGLFQNMTVGENIISAIPQGVERLGLIQKGRLQSIAGDLIKNVKIKTYGVKQNIEKLSGGNQQKVIIAKWLAKKPKVFLLDEISRGIDVGSKAEIFKMMQALREQGMSVIMVSSEIDEILAECDRTLIMRQGEIISEFNRGEMVKKRMVAQAMGFEDEEF